VTQAIEDVRALRAGLHARAFELNSQGRTEAAQAVWAVVEELDALLNRLDERRR
jgi:hypothetical protein